MDLHYLRGSEEPEKIKPFAIEVIGAIGGGTGPGEMIHLNGAKALSVLDDSMEPDIPKGRRVIYIEGAVKVGDFVVFKHKKKWVARFYQKAGRRAHVFTPKNPAFEPVILDAKPVEIFKVIGDLC